MYGIWKWSQSFAVIGWTLKLVALDSALPGSLICTLFYRQTHYANIAQAYTLSYCCGTTTIQPCRWWHWWALCHARNGTQRHSTMHMLAWAGALPHVLRLSCHLVTWALSVPPSKYMVGSPNKASKPKPWCFCTGRVRTASSFITVETRLVSVGIYSRQNRHTSRGKCKNIRSYNEVNQFEGT